MGMRTLILLALALSAAAADREQFTLKDGRVIVGTYDETTQTLQIESPKAAMHVDARDIAKREEAPEASVTAIATTPIKSSAMAPKGVPAPMAALIEQKRKADALRVEAEAAQQEYGKARMAAIDGYFLHDADLTPIPVKVADNPTGVQLDDAHRATEFNDALARVAKWRENELMPKDDPVTYRKTHIRRMENPVTAEVISEYAKRKHAAWLLDL